MVGFQREFFRIYNFKPPPARCCTRPRVVRAREGPKRAKIRVRRKRIRMAVGPVVRLARDLILTARV
jgi:hypothetical protein